MLWLRTSRWWFCHRNCAVSTKTKQNQTKATWRNETFASLRSQSSTHVPLSPQPSNLSTPTHPTTQDTFFPSHPFPHLMWQTTTHIASVVRCCCRARVTKNIPQKRSFKIFEPDLRVRFAERWRDFLAKSLLFALRQRCVRTTLQKCNCTGPAVKCCPHVVTVKYWMFCALEQQQSSSSSSSRRSSKKWNSKVHGSHAKCSRVQLLCTPDRFWGSAWCLRTPIPRSGGN